ncbi:MAG: outer membrane lipoprotein-sorting protein [Bacteroidia bacterium]|nr:MAG: outer membrane lipoprotein-sorting protein [Bacteroidia bacterium]
MKATLRTSILGLCALLTSLSAGAEDGRAIMQRAHDRPMGDTRTAEVEMTLVNKRGRKRVRSLRSYSMDIGKDRKTIMHFLAPSDVRGTGFLTWDYDDPAKADDKWLYLPAMRKTRRISSASSKKDYFMGSDFTYDDMGKRNVDEDTHKFLREEEYQGQPCWVVECTPREKGHLYARREVWVGKETLLPLQAKFYDKQNKLQRVLTTGKVVKIDGFWTYEAQTMENVQTGHKTLIRFSKMSFNRPIPEDYFTVVRLEKGI